MSPSPPLPPNPARNRRIVTTSAIVIGCGWLLALAAEMLIFTLCPNEIMGWGERPSLQPDEELGWRLLPSTRTRLRWRGYDYLVTSNSMGFPGPEPPQATEESTIRILALGSGSTSAEGVDTADSWPRRLEESLNGHGRPSPVAVINLAVTGYGLDQHVILAKRYIPRFRPALVMVALAPGDFGKIRSSIEKRGRTIGFDRPSPSSIVTVLSCQHLLRLTIRTMRERVSELVSGPEGLSGWQLGQFSTFEVKNLPELADCARTMTQRLAEIQKVVRRESSTLLVVLIPSPIQTCSPNQIRYFPRGVDLQDRSRFDLDQPQRLLVSILNDLGIQNIDLREVLQPENGICTFHSNNMHPNAAGHQLIASYLSPILADQLSAPH